MTKAAEQLLEQAMRLAPDDRAELIDGLFELDDPTVDEPAHAEAWAAEIRERKAQVDRGEETPIPWREATARIRRGKVGHG